MRVWRYRSLALYGLTLVALMLAYPARRRALFVLWALNLAGFWHTLERSLPAAIPMGLLAAIKPNFVLWPAFLVLARERKLGLMALAVTSLVSLAPFLLEGPGIYARGLEVTPSLSETAAAMARIGGNSSLIALTGRFALAPLGIVLSLALAAGLGRPASTRRLHRQELSALAMIGALLLSQYRRPAAPVSRRCRA